MQRNQQDGFKKWVQFWVQCTTKKSSIKNISSSWNIQNWVYGFKLQLKKKNFFYLLLMFPRTIKVNEESAKHPSCTWIQISFQNLKFLIETKLNLASCQKVISWGVVAYARSLSQQHTCYWPLNAAVREGRTAGNRMPSFLGLENGICCPLNWYKTSAIHWSEAKQAYPLLLPSTW